MHNPVTIKTLKWTRQGDSVSRWIPLHSTKETGTNESRTFCLWSISFSVECTLAPNSRRQARRLCDAPGTGDGNVKRCTSAWMVKEHLHISNGQGVAGICRFGVLWWENSVLNWTFHIEVLRCARYDDNEMKSNSAHYLTISYFDVKKCLNIFIYIYRIS